MRTGSGNRSTYSRTTGSRTARLYSKRTAKRINKIYNQSQADRVRNIKYDSLENDYESYDDYYNDPIYKKQENKGRIKTAVLSAVVTAAVIALIIAALAVIRPFNLGETGRILGINNQAAPARTGTEIQTTNPVPQDTEIIEQTSEKESTTTYEESDPPVIYGVMPIVVYAGHSVIYKQGIHVTDDNDPDPVLEIDNAAVDLSVPGTYIVTYIARDRSGNVTRVPTTVTVLAGQNIISDEEIYELADSILDYVITDSEDTDAKKCLKVYEYLHAIGYIDEVHSEDWMQNAYWMLTLREGDCFCYYSAARLLLTRLGYEVMEVRNNNNYVHFWCLVSTDGGETWWHFDPTCWSWGEDGVLCLVSDTYLDEFTHRHKTSDGRLIHSWDRSNYPATPEYDFWTDEDRAVIYEGGLIQMNPQYDDDDDIWRVNNGWDYYPLTYGFDQYSYDYYEQEAYDNGYTEEYDSEDTEDTEDTGDTEYTEDPEPEEEYYNTGEYGEEDYDPAEAYEAYESDYYNTYDYEEPEYDGADDGYVYSEDDGYSPQGPGPGYWMDEDDQGEY